MTKDEAEIRSIIADHAKAHYAKNVLLAHGGEGFHSFDLAPPLQNKGGSPKDARREIEAWFATWKGPISLEERDLAVTAGDNVAFSTSLTHMTGAKTDGTEVSLWFRSTNGFRKQNGKWKIVPRTAPCPPAPSETGPAASRRCPASFPITSLRSFGGSSPKASRASAG
jgi:ketosteroid isomerase-like protein